MNSMEPYERSADRNLRAMLRRFERSVDRYRLVLNNEGVWLFLAVLGCWGVPDPGFQIAATWIALIIFGYRIYSDLHDQQSFSRMQRELREAISLDLPFGETQQARLKELEEMVKRKLSWPAALKSTAIYVMCYGFLVLSLCYFGEVWPFSERKAATNCQAVVSDVSQTGH